MKQQGQALVEFAIVAPILIFLLVGLFEVGWALRGFLVLSNINRESARYAVRTGVLNFETPHTQEEIGYSKVWSYTAIQAQESLPLLVSNTTIIITYISINAPCTMPYTITTPTNVPTHTWKLPITSPHQTRLDYSKIISTLLPRQIEYSCAVSDKGGIPLANNMITVELFYHQPQLFGFPIIANPLTDPVPMYAHTTFRKAVESR